MEIKKKVKETILRHNLLEGVRHLVLGFSGGPDSMCLLDILQDLSREMNFSISLVHVDHGIRKGVSQEEAEFCKRVAEERNLTIKVFSFDCEEVAKDLGISTEEAGRKIRYDSFGDAVKEIGEEGVAVAVAQNADDQVETVLMRILRGTGPEGLAGIPYKRLDHRGFTVIRPLLDVYKEEILSYLSDSGLEYCKDLTNEEPIYHRNKIRLELIPYLEKEYNPAIKDALIRLSDSAREDREYLKSIAGEVDIVRSRTPETVILKGDDLRKLPKALRKRIVSRTLGDLGLTEDIGYGNYMDCEKLIFAEGASKEIDLPKGFYMAQVYDDVALGKRIDVTDNNPDIPMDIRRLTIDEFRGLDLTHNRWAAFDEEKLNSYFGEEAVSRMAWRERKEGDIIKLKAGSKKIQDLMVDSKIPKQERSLARVLAIGNEVLWFVPKDFKLMRWTKDFAVDRGTNRVVLIIEALPSL